MTGPSVWPVAQRPGREQRRGRYLAESLHHPAKMLPALAQRAIETYSLPGDFVVDPMCGIGTTLVEAAHLGRDAFGIEYEPQWAALASANLAHARQNGAHGDAEVVVGDCRDVRGLLPPEVVGQVALVLTSPPYGPTAHGRLERDGVRVRKAGHRYSSDRANLAYSGMPALVSAIETTLRAAGHVLAADGRVVVSARPWRRHGALVDLPGIVVQAGERAGLVLVDRKVALLAAFREGRLVSRASFFSLKDVRAAREQGVPQLVVAHEDVLVFGRRR
jgi:predicted RNA methylase